MPSVKIQSIAQAAKGSLFTICIEGESCSEIEKFIQKYSESYNKDLNVILTAIKHMLNASGFLERYFRPEGKMNDRVCALPIQSGKLRLYCLRINDSILIAGNGGVKNAQKYQDCDELNGYVVDLQKLDKALKVAVKSGNVVIEENTISGIDNTFEL